MANYSLPLWCQIEHSLHPYVGQVLTKKDFSKIIDAVADYLEASSNCQKPDFSTQNDCIVQLRLQAKIAERKRV